MVLFPLFLVYLAPLIDWAVSAGKGISMGYIYIPLQDMLLNFATFFGVYSDPGITIGIRLELIAMFIGVGVFVYLATKSIFRGVASALVLYVIAFCIVITPITIGMIGSGHTDVLGAMHFVKQSTIEAASLSSNIHSTLTYIDLDRMIEIGFNFMMAKIWFVVTLMLGFWWFIGNNKKETIAVFKNSRPERVSHYIFLIFVGMYIAYTNHSYHINWNDMITIVMLVCAYYFSWMFAVAINDVYDQNIDVVSNTNRPITGGTLSVEKMKSIAGLFLILGLIAGYLAGYHAFFYVLTFNAFYYFYSVPPLRVKVLSVICPFFFGLMSLGSIFAGYFTFSPDKSLVGFPTLYIWVTVLSLFCIQHIKDLKDIEGDKCDGIITLPIIFGNVWGPRVVGILAGLSYIILAYVVHNTFAWILSITAASVTYWLCARKNYVEGPIFGIYYLYILILVALYFITK
jgi:4-hydroxybenzoate polyprenyltransferase